MRIQLVLARLVLGCAILALAGCADEASESPLSPESGIVQTPAALDGPVPIRDETGWSRMVSDSLWEHVAQYDTTVVVGLKAPEERRGIWRGTLLIDAPGRQTGMSEVAAVPDVEVIGEMTDLPVLEVKVGSPQAIQILRSLPWTDYVEPAVMDVGLASSGCGYPPWNETAGTTSSGDILPPHYERADVQIDRAWIRSAGEDVVIGISDTGVSQYQYQLTDWFADGASAGRWYYHTSVIPGDGANPGWHDQCGHGTRAAGVIAAPMDGENMVGVAWKSDLVTVRAADDVIMPRTSATANAVALAAAHTPSGEVVHDRRVVLLAWGHEFSFSTVKDEIERRYHNDGVLFIGASGTTGWWGSWTGVIFPARMDEVIAVSAVKPDYSKTSLVHYGPEVELSFIVHQVTTGLVASDVVWISGSSSAATVVAGMAALVWSEYPTQSRDWVRERLRWAGSNYPARDDSLGYGITDTWKAVGGLYDGVISTQLLQTVQFSHNKYRVTAVPSGDGPFTYAWHTGATSAYIDVTVSAGQSSWVQVTMSDNGASLQREKWLQGPPSPTASIDGPSVVPSNALCAWTAQTNSPDSPYTYEWTVNKSVIGTGSVVYYSSSSSFTLGLKVTDSEQRPMTTSLNVSVDPGHQGTCNAT